MPNLNIHKVKVMILWPFVALWIFFAVFAFVGYLIQGMDMWFSIGPSIIYGLFWSVLVTLVAFFLDLME